MPAGRPKVQINWDEFARTFLEDLWGGAIPAFIDPIAKVRRIVNRLEPDEKLFWLGTPLYPARRASLDSRLKSAVSAWVQKHRGNQDAFEFCGFTLQELKSHLESRFEPWMTWDNWGEWHVDHVIPRSRYLKPYSRSEVFSLQNLRPISRSDNLRKANRHE